MSATPDLNRTFTEKEYFDLLRSSQHRMEFHDGQITMMAGAKRNHNRIIRNLIAASISNSAGCSVYTSDTAVHIPSDKSYYYPDLFAVCGEESFDESDGIEKVLNPSLLVEVLSPSTRSRDEGLKFSGYKTLPSFQEYVAIDSEALLVKTYYKATSGQWEIGSFYRLDQSVEIKTLQLQLPMVVIYAGIDFEGSNFK